MKLSTRGRYGTRALVDLAIHSQNGPVLLKDIARRQEISRKYLDRIFTTLKAAGLVKSHRGAKGGYTLNIAPSKLKLSKVIEVLEGSIAPVECVDDKKLCHRINICVTRDVWKKIRDSIQEVLDSTTLQDLVESDKKKRRSLAKMYYI